MFVAIMTLPDVSALGLKAFTGFELTSSMSGRRAELLRFNLYAVIGFP